MKVQWSLGSDLQHYFPMKNGRLLSLSFYTDIFYLFIYIFLSTALLYYCIILVLIISRNSTLTFESSLRKSLLA